MSPELALVDPVAAAAHRSALPRVVLDSAIVAARTARPRVVPAPAAPGRIQVSFAVPVWVAVASYVVLKVTVAVLVAMALVGSIALAGTVVPH